MSEIFEAIDNRDGPSVNGTVSRSNSDDESETAKLLKRFCQGNDKCGDWKRDDDVWYMSPERATDEIEYLEPEKVTEWKCRNVYSMPVSNNSNPAYWSPRAAAIIKTEKSSEILEVAENCNQEKSDMSKIEKTDGDFLDALREYLVNYQESSGVPRDEYSFLSLMRVMAQATGHSLIALFYIVVSISPLIQLFLFVLRFVLDKLISIRNMGFSQQSVVKYTILGGQLACIYVCLVFIFGFIVLPILHLVLAILGKILLFN